MAVPLVVASTFIRTDSRLPEPNNFLAFDVECLVLLYGRVKWPGCGRHDINEFARL